DVCGQAPLNTKIFGGENATAGSWPWQASSYLTQHWVETTQLFFRVNRVSDIVIYLRRLTQNGSNPHEISMSVIKVIKHPKYNSLDSSLAMLQLSSSVPFTDYIKPVCLAAAGSVFAAGTESWVTGWGLNEEIKFPDILQEVEALVVNNIECNDAYGGIITDNLMCAGFLDEGEKAQCLGDAGSPLVTRQGFTWIQFGVAVYSHYCAEPGYPAVYVRVSEYQDWISSYTRSSSVNLLSFSLTLAFSIIPLIFFHFF
uniref:Zgc:163079 n=1 Tax=Sinocyclocheilus grahami TaxID=75366 RepID=A0A672PF50_SINGR